MTREFLPPEQWYGQLPMLYAAACALITDTQGRVLLVKPNYRDHWNIPGGFVDHDEPPHEACARELTEELGLQLTVGNLLVIDWAKSQGDRPRPITSWFFDAGTLTADQIAAIRLQTEELDEYAFVTPEQAATLLPGNVAPRIPAALDARRQRHTIYLPRS
ncbi:NUDIX domain-containing protein [Embleya sp. MST-111070]|uniref:NUDIX domain-containing protein n=1 Tax=Embleya sp. MST-111070 TaxID=3398231 RepID=UPI003F73F4D4